MASKELESTWQENWSWNPLFDRIVASISLMADDSMEHEIRAFFKRNPTPGTERTQEQMLEKIRIHSKFLRQIRKEFKNWVNLAIFVIYSKSNYVLILDLVFFID